MLVCVPERQQQKPFDLDKIYVMGAPAVIKGNSFLTKLSKYLLVILFIIPANHLGCGTKPEPEKAVPSLQFGDAAELLKRGDADAAIAALQQIIQETQNARSRNKAALFLGSILVDLNRHHEAIAPLETAASGSVGPNYASILLVKCAVEGGMSDRYLTAAARAEHLAGGSSDETSLLLQKEAVFLLCKLRFLQESWTQTIDAARLYLKKWPETKAINEIQWKLAEALTGDRQYQKAHKEYEKIWYENPSSPWAKEAHAHIKKLIQQHGYKTPRLSPNEHYDFVKALRKAGLHKDALAEAGAFEKTHRGHTKMDGMLFMKTMSLHAIRKNSECLSTVKELEKRFPRSRWKPAAQIYGIKVLRRSDNTPQVVKMCNHVYSSNRGHDKAYEALYNLGVYLSNVETKQEGLKVLWRLVREAPKHALADDALWKISLMERYLGHHDKSHQALEQILREHPKSGFRKATLYWLAKTLQKMGRTGVEEYYQTLVKEFPNDYYGHKALENLLVMGAKPQQIGNGRALTGIDTLEDDTWYTGPGKEHYKLACFLKEIGLFKFAADELNEIPGIDKRPDLQFALAELYSRSGDTSASARTLGRHFKEFMISGSRDPSLVPQAFWQICYPLNYRSTIERAIKNAGLASTKVDPYLVAALIRMESRFMPTAISYVGAIGLMQLMPETAKEIAEERGLLPPTREDMFKPETNIEYGTYFLAKRVQDFNGEWFPAICSYNAGTGPVRKWWKEKPPGQDLDEFIETIPYSATRLYIKQILGDYNNYEWLYPL